MRADCAKGQKGSVGRWAPLPQRVVELQRVNRCWARQGSRQAELIALASVQGILAGLHIVAGSQNPILIAPQGVYATIP